MRWIIYGSALFLGGLVKTWSNGKIIEGKKQIDSLNFSLHYAGPCVWEGIRSYKQEDGRTFIFMLEAHIDRLFDSAKIMGFEIPYTKKEIIQGCADVVDGNGGGDLYLRPISYVDQDAESVRTDAKNISVDIYSFPIHDLHDKKDGIKLAISSYSRGYPQFQMQAKTASNYNFLHMIKHEMEKTGVDDLLLTDNQGYITEATVANIFIIKGDVIMTPPNDGSILPGITRRCLGQIIQNSNIMWGTYKKAPVLIEKNITRADLYTANCVILCGTYAEVVRVDEIDGRKIGTPETQEYYKILRRQYTKLVRGEEDDRIDSRKES